jgi:hypothetical protein
VYRRTVVFWGRVRSVSFDDIAVLLGKRGGSQRLFRLSGRLPMVSVC